MNRNALHPLRLLPALGASPRQRASALEPAIEQWFAEDFRSHDDPPVQFEIDVPSRVHPARRQAVEEAVSWTIVPDSGRSIPDLEQ
ncbi:MAG TPA: hypothetical protein VFL14_10875 [Xanthomonadales bacterium]|nr:hypothetical protein [Xanthomonadales bacterium]